MGSNIEELARSTILTRQESLNCKKFSACSARSRPKGLCDPEHISSTDLRRYRDRQTSCAPATTTPCNHFGGLGTFAASAIPRLHATIPRAIALHSELLYDIPLEAGGSSRIAVLHSDLSDTVRSAIMARSGKARFGSSLPQTYSHAVWTSVALTVWSTTTYKLRRRLCAPGREDR
jgi:ATP-dependent RNA helicase DDX52/ROK1